MACQILRNPKESLEPRDEYLARIDRAIDFSRGFEQHDGVAPSRFDWTTHRDSRRGEFDRSQPAGPWMTPFQRLSPGENPDGFLVILRDLPARTVAYIRVRDPYHSFDAVTGAYSRLAA